MGSPEKERARFSVRLGAALSESGWKKTSASRLAREFNQNAGDGAVTLHAARKWLKGGAIPTQARVILLASLFNVTAEWLRFGSNPHRSELTQFDTQDAMLLADVARLSGVHKQLAREMVGMLLRVSGKPVPSQP